MNHMQEFILFIVVVVLSLYFKNNASEGIGQYVLYLIIASLLAIIYRYIRYS